MRKIKLFLITLVVLTLYQNPSSAQSNTSPIDTATEARYRYIQETYSYAIIDQGLGIDALSIYEREQLSPKLEEAEHCIGVNSSNQQFYQVRQIQTAVPEAWMSKPNIQLITPNKSLSLNALGEEIYAFDHNTDMLTELTTTATYYANNGFTPIMTLFPNIHDDFVADAVFNGAQLVELSETKFKLITPNFEVTINTEERSIKTEISTQEETSTLYQKYTLYSPYGYVLQYSEETRRSLDANTGITQMSRSAFTNHVIEDFNNRIPKYTEVSEIKVYPNPVANDYEVVLIGIPEAQVSSVQVRDYMGNLIATHNSPNIDGDMIYLNAETYPTGTFILQVYTNQGIFTELISK